jgi:hypothetical protein
MEEKGQSPLVPKGAASTKSIVDPAVPKDMPSGAREGPRNWPGLLGDGEVVGGSDAVAAALEVRGSTGRVLMRSRLLTSGRGFGGCYVNGSVIPQRLGDGVGDGRENDESRGRGGRWRNVRGSSS